MIQLWQAILETYIKYVKHKKNLNIRDDVVDNLRVFHILFFKHWNYSRDTGCRVGYYYYNKGKDLSDLTKMVRRIYIWTW